MKQKTPLAELLKYLDEFQNKPIQPTTQNIKEKIWQLLPKEKEVMKDFYLTACTEYSQTETALQSDIKAFETYFNETFTQK